MVVEAAPTSYSETAVSAIIEERIRSGVYPPGARVPAERVLAEELGVSRRFVRMAYSRLIDQGLLEKSHYRRPFVTFDGRAPQRSGNVAAAAAPSTRSSPAVSSRTIAAVLPSHPAFPGGLSMVAGIHKVLADRESPYRLTFLDTFHKDRPEVLRREAKAIQSAVEDGVAGLIWWYYSDEDMVREILRSNPDLAVVFIDRHPSDLHCDFVGIDDQESSREAVEYLMDLGHARIAHLKDPGSYSTIVEREHGYRAALSGRGIPVRDELIVHLDWAEDRMERAFDRLYSPPEPPTALFTSNDFIAYEFIEVAEARGVRVPDQLSVVGHGNIDRYAPRQFLTSVDQPFEMIGQAAAKILLQRLAGTSGTVKSYQHMILQAPLIVRSSCRRLTE